MSKKIEIKKKSTLFPCALSLFVRCQGGGEEGAVGRSYGITHIVIFVTLTKKKTSMSQNKEVHHDLLAPNGQLHTRAYTQNFQPTAAEINRPGS